MDAVAIITSSGLGMSPPSDGTATCMAFSPTSVLFSPTTVRVFFADGIYVRLSPLMLVPVPVHWTWSVYIGLPWAVVLLLPLCLPQDGMSQGSALDTVRHCCCANSVDAAVMLGFATTTLVLRSA